MTAHCPSLAGRSQKGPSLSLLGKQSNHVFQLMKHLSDFTNWESLEVGCSLVLQEHLVLNMEQVNISRLQPTGSAK